MINCCADLFIFTLCRNCLHNIFPYEYTQPETKKTAVMKLYLIYVNFFQLKHWWGDHSERPSQTSLFSPR